MGWKVPRGCTTEAEAQRKAQVEKNRLSADALEAVLCESFGCSSQA